MKWLKDGLSIDETKMSTIIVMAIVSLGVGLYIAITRGDVPSELASIIITFGLLVAGEYGINSISSVLNSKNLNGNTLNTRSTNDYTTNYYEEDSK